MDFNKLKTSIQSISEIASSVPEKFRDKCFDLLLSALLKEQSSSDDGHPDEPDAGNDGPKPPTGPAPPGNPAPIPMTTQLRLFMRKADISEEELKKVLLVSDGEVHFVKEPTIESNRAGQTEWALLLALKSAIQNDSLSADPEQVRSKCQAVGCYDTANFAANFKDVNVKSLFKSAMKKQGEPAQLSNAGVAALGALVKRLAAQ